MTNAEFDTLLARRTYLEDLHREMCEEINGPVSYNNDMLPYLRDACYAELQQVDATIAAEVERETQDLFSLECNCDSPNQIQCDMHGPRE